MRYYSLTIWLFLSFGCFELMAQTPARLLQKAKAEISKEEYIKAIETLSPLMQEGNENSEAILLTGYSFLNLPGEDADANALHYLELASRLFPLTNKPSKNAIEAHFFLAMALHQNYKFNEAIALYKRLIASTKQKNLINSFNREMQYSQNAIELTKTPLEFQIYSLGQAINSP